MAYYRDEPFLDNNSIFANFPAAKNNSAFLNLKKNQQAEQTLMAQKVLK